MNLKVSLELSCTLSIHFVDFFLNSKNYHFNFSCIFLFFFFQKSYKFVSNCLLCSFYWVGFRISLSLSAIFRDKIENYFSCPHLARQDRDYHMTILVFRDENKITHCYSHVSSEIETLENHFSWSSEKKRS